VASTVLLEAHARAAAAGSPPRVPASEATKLTKAPKATKATKAPKATKATEATKVTKAGSLAGAPAPERAAGDEPEATREAARARKKPRTRK
jgi:bifunctional non-homologous end joining protein LigD